MHHGDPESNVCAGEDEDQFEQFMLPLTAAFEAVAQMLSTNTFNEQEAKVPPSPCSVCVLFYGIFLVLIVKCICCLQRTLVGLVRDLRGIAFAFNAKTSFMMLFDWMYPDRFPDLFFFLA